MLPTLFLIAFAVAMDATAVSASMALRRARPGILIALASTFGVFQFGMSLAGGVGGAGLTRWTEAWDHWVAFVLLAVVGGKMIHEALSVEHEHALSKGDLGIHTLLVLGVATSIDALAVGVTLPTLHLPLFLSALVIGAVTFVLSLGGAWAGRRFGERFGSGIEILGGLVLIGIGVHTLIEHLMA
ncbi:MAG: manganese efflux pump MntP family protein [Thermoanaerobaculia bacterium]